MRMGLMSRCAITVALVLTGWHTYAAADLNAQYRLNVPPLPVFEALKEFAAQTNLQVVYYSEVAQGIDSPGAVGQLTAGDALGKILGGTGLTFQFLNDRTIAIRIAGTAGQSDRTQTPSAPQSLNNSQTPSPDTAKKAGWFDRFRLAQAESSTSASPSATSAAEEKIARASDDDVIELGEVVVTGSHIRGAESPGSNVIVLDREDIDRTGLATVPDVLRTLPQNFNGGVREGPVATSREGVTNPNKGVALNLRGLGPGSTLTLLNGRRLAPGGGSGLFTDISNLPLTAIERIEVLPDGASALYGSDAIGGVVNFIMREGWAGAETRARVGAATEGDFDEYQLSQALGTGWGSGNGLVSAEYYKRGALATEDRSQAATSDLRSLGGGNFNIRNGNPGNIVIGSGTWAIPAGQDGTSLTSGQLVAGTLNLYPRLLNADLVGEQARWNVFGTIRQELSQHLSLFADALVGERDADLASTGVRSTLTVTSTNPFYVNPTGGTGPVRVTYDFFDDLGPIESHGEVRTVNTAAGLTLDTGAGWQVTGYVGYALEKSDRRSDGNVDSGALAAVLNNPDPAIAFNPFGDGSHTSAATLAAIRSHALSTTDSDLRTANVTADGPLFQLPGGPVKLAVGVDYREQSFDDSFITVNASGPGAPFTDSFGREVSAAFGEFLIPLIGAGNRRRGMERLEFSMAARYEEYSDFGSAITPRYGLTWLPLAGLAVRAAWSESFKAPNLPDLSELGNFSLLLPFTDATSPSGFTDTLTWFGNNADLREETATSWTVGFELKPQSLPHLSFGASYFDIEYSDRIADRPFIGDIQANPAEIVILNPTAAQLANVCSRGTYDSGDPADCRNPDLVKAIVDVRISNVAITKTRGLDMVGTYEFDTRLGRFELGVNATRLFEYAQAATRQSPTIDELDTVGHPLNLRLRNSISWQRNNFDASIFINYTDDYRDTVSQPNRAVDSWTTADLQLAYRLEPRAWGWLGNTRFSLSAQNLFDKEPPFFNNPAGVGYDPENATLSGRLISLSARKTW